MIQKNSFREVNIVIVDDDSVELEAMLRQFQRLSNPIFSAASAEAALQLLRGNEAQPPFLIILDVTLPGMSGIEFLHELRADEHLKSATVFVMAGSDDPALVHEAYQYHAAGFIAKASIRDDFSRVVDMCERFGRIIEFPC